MLRRLILVVAVASVLAPSGAAAEKPGITLKASLGTGGDATLAFSGTGVCWEITLSAVADATGAHVHATASGRRVLPLGGRYAATGCMRTRATRATTSSSSTR